METQALDFPNMIVRTLQGPCGLFDTGLVDDAELQASSAGISIKDEFGSVNFAELFPTSPGDQSADAKFEGFNFDMNKAIKTDLPKSEFNDIAQDSFDSSLNESNDSSLLDDSFLEQFTDLSNFLPDECLNEGTFDPEEFFNGNSFLEGSEADMFFNENKPVKRTASEAFIKDDSVFQNNPDHSDYTIKDIIKRPRSSTISVTSESDIQSESSVSVSNMDSIEEKEKKYKERRRKNNIASRRSRETRKQKFSNMEKQANDLEKANEELRRKAAQLEKIAKLMKDILVQKLASVGPKITV